MKKLLIILALIIMISGCTNVDQTTGNSNQNNGGSLTPGAGNITQEELDDFLSQLEGMEFEDLGGLTND